jgi:Rieske Fe-S protein
MNALPSLSRRTVISLGGVTILGAGAVALTACSPAGAASGAGAGAAAQPNGNGSSTKLASGTTVLALADVPVGGTASATVNGQQLVLSQPTAGTVACFSAICTHMGCPVNATPKDFECPCHGSVFNSTTGAALQGPAVAPLTKVPVKVSGGNVVTT